MMAKRLLICLFLLTVWLASASGADPSPGTLLRRVSAARFEITGGRISNPALPRAPSRSFSADDGGIKESLSINPTSDEPSLSYRFTAPGREWSVEFRSLNSLTLSDKSDEESLVFQQLPNAPLKLTMERSGSPKREFVGRTVWHLLAFSPEAASYLLPQLELLHSGWGLAEQAAEIKELLVKGGSADWRQERTAWQRSVEQLGSADYQQRQTADRRLRAGGTATAAYLQTLDRARLEPEQLRRVSRIVEAASLLPEEPASIAAGWMYDAEVWCALLRDDSAEHRTAAASHLAELLGRPVKFDPTADAPTRAAQVRLIEETLLRR